MICQTLSLRVFRYLRILKSDRWNQESPQGGVIHVSWAPLRKTRRPNGLLAIFLSLSAPNLACQAQRCKSVGCRSLPNTTTLFTVFCSSPQMGLKLMEKKMPHGSIAASQQKLEIFQTTLLPLRRGVFFPSAASNRSDAKGPTTLPPGEWPISSSSRNSQLQTLPGFRVTTANRLYPNKIIALRGIQDLFD